MAEEKYEKERKFKDGILRGATIKEMFDEYGVL